MRRFVAIFTMLGALLVVASGTAAASHKGEPQGAYKKQWACILDLTTWHCVPPGVELGGPSGPSLNWECVDPEDELCAEVNPEGPDGFSLGPPEGTHFVGTENLMREDLYADQPCPQGTGGLYGGPVDLGVASYFFCHHYG